MSNTRRHVAVDASGPIPSHDGIAAPVHQHPQTPVPNLNLRPYFRSDWRPLPDPQKPSFPYENGLSLSIRRHVAPVPFGFGYVKRQARTQGSRMDLYDVTHSEWCLRNPPEQTPDSTNDETHTIQLVEEIACEDRRGAQVVLCSLDHNRDTLYVAKIYDALYYAYDGKACGTPRDVTWLADSDYSREVAAYEQLCDSGADGLYAPKYFGSWTFSLPHPGYSDDLRPVRMVLMEYMRGAISMDSLLVDDEQERIDPQHRLDILARAMEVESHIGFQRVEHRDFAPRNVLLVGSASEKRMPDIYLVDFNIAMVMGGPYSRWKGRENTQPLSPRYRFWDQCPPAWLSWVPEPLTLRPKAFKGWLKAQWEGRQDFAGLPPSMLVFRLRNWDDPVESLPPVWGRTPRP